MKNRNLTLLRTMLRSGSLFNIIKYSRDSKKRGRAFGTIAGICILFAVMLFYVLMMCYGYSRVGLQEAIPAMCALIISAASFFLTILKTNGYLFAFKEYDMLMSLPFRPSEIAGTKFAYMYIKSLPWYLGISLSFLAGYGIFARPGIAAYPIWILLSFFLPLIPMIAAAGIGLVIAKIGSRFRKTNVVQTVLVFTFVFLCFGVQIALQTSAQNGDAQSFSRVMTTVSDVVDAIAGYYIPVRWFYDAVSSDNIAVLVIGIALLVLVSIAFLAAVVFLIGRRYREINSALKTHAAKRSGKGKSRSRSVRGTIAYKELKRMLGSTVYLTNAGVGLIMAFVLGVAALFVDMDTIIAEITSGSPLTTEMVIPAIPFIVYFLVGMVSTTTYTPSLEGRNFWILKSLPVSRTVVYQGKMLFNMYLTVPFMVWATLCLCISARTGFLTTVLFLVQGLVLCSFSTVFGCVCGIRFMRLDWENDVEIVKQGAAITIYLIPNMFVTMALLTVAVILGGKIRVELASTLFTAAAAPVTGLLYLLAMKMSRKA